MKTIGSSCLPFRLINTLLFSFFLLVSVGANAQIVESIGLKSGITFSNQEWTYGRDSFNRTQKTRTGVNIAFITEMFSSEYFSLSTDLGYIQKGSVETWAVTDENNPEGNGETVDINSRYDFLYFSPQAKLKLPMQQFTPYVLLGPRLDYYVHSASKNELLVSALLYSMDVNNVIFGLNYGIGIQYDFDAISIFIEGQYQQDITKFFSNEPGPNNTGLDVTNSAWLVNLGAAYRFGD